MFRVIESDVETAQAGKRFDLSALSVCVTDRADVTGWIGKLLCVAACAGRMCRLAGQGRLRRVVFTTVAKQTRESRVIASGVFELRIRRLSREKADEAQKYSENHFALT